VKVGYVTDLHGNIVALEQFLEYAAREKVDAVIIGGDLTPKEVVISLFREDVYDDPEDDDSLHLVGGETIPVALLRREGKASTYTRALENAEKLNARLGSEEALRIFKRRGALVHKLTNGYYTLPDMLAEQRLVDALCQFVSSRTEIEKFDLRGEDLEWSVDLLQTLILGGLNALDPKERENIMRPLLKIGQVRDELSAASLARRLSLGLLAELRKNELGKLAHLLKSSRPPLPKDVLGTYLETELDALVNDLIRNIAMLQALPTTFVQMMVNETAAAALAREAVKPEVYSEGQARFIKQDFLPFVRTWSVEQGIPVSFMLGNDDHIENEKLLEDADIPGDFTHIGGKVADLGALQVVGYGFVETLPEGVGYRVWEKTSEEIYQDLCALHERARPDAIWVIHNPPMGVLDGTSRGPVGSDGVRKFIEEKQPRLALFGHIHEAPYYAKTTNQKLGQTLCVNPGAEHENGVQAVIVDIENLNVTDLGKEVK
jgi:Icc-related predicted phosphoesterase